MRNQAVVSSLKQGVAGKVFIYLPGTFPAFADSPDYE
jgi:hypothetical protein